MRQYRLCPPRNCCRAFRLRAKKPLPFFVSLIVVTVTLFVLSFSPLSAQTETLTLSTAATPPLSTRAQDGFLDTIAKQMFKRNNLDLDIIHLPAERALRSSNSGVIDGELIRIEGMEKIYKNLIPVPETIFIQEFVAFTKNPSLEIRGWDDLKPLTVAYIKGWKIFEINIPKQTKTIIAKDTGQLFALLEKNRVDAVLLSKLLGQDVIFRRKQGGIQMSPPLMQKNMHLFLHRKHKNLIPGLDKALKEIKAEGIYDEKLNALEKKYSRNE